MSVNFYQSDFEDFIEVIGREINGFCKSLKVEDFFHALHIIQDSERKGGRVHVTGIGKPGHVSGYISSLLSSTGTPAYTLHGTEAVHGSAGQVVPGDVVIAISNSGETAELKSTVMTVKNNGAYIIGVSGKKDSWIAKVSDAFLYAGVSEEGGPLNRAPRASILAEIIVLQALSVLLQCSKGLTPSQYVKWHPGGMLGILRDDEVKV
ncbi:SIS domain-containing protein [Acetivibrio cellulolyticus]|uniref:SIS domain-containing protein n=1 Tax=Acetivibrio cellulolyticus TaxID=35830 RepID=UPI0001E2C704|nr:SIS domain-containing protein [Acetivibrio cellulolyticus]